VQSSGIEHCEGSFGITFLLALLAKAPVLVDEARHLFGLRFAVCKYSNHAVYSMKVNAHVFRQLTDATRVQNESV